MQAKSHPYAKILRAMAVLKARDEANLATTQRHMAQLREENETLYAMMRRESYADFVSPALIAKRVKCNHERQHVYHLTEARQKKTLLQSSRRYDRFEEKYKVACQEEEQKKQTLNIDEYVSKFFS